MSEANEIKRCKNEEHPLYSAWKNMRQRCRNPENKDYKDYGGRGIYVCPEWEDFWTYVNDVESLSYAYEEGRSIDRVDNNDGYYLKNVRWATNSEQQRNKRRYGKGYTFVKKQKNKPWRVQLSVDGKVKNFGSFATEEEAKTEANKIKKMLEKSRCEID